MTQKNIFITGCSSGIGLNTARNLKKRGYRVLAGCRKNEDLVKLAAEGFDAIEIDLDDSHSIKQAANQILALTQNKLYAIFNNAGFGVYGYLNSITRTQLEQQFSSNFFGVHELTQCLLPAMIEQKEGRIIQTSSIMGFISTPGRGAYAASKYALEAWSDALRLELKGTGIQVSLIEPGPVQTQFTQNVNQTQKNDPIHNPSIATKFTVTPDDILPIIYHALESKHAKIRYKISLMTKAVGILKRLLPDKLMDKILQNKH
ncbi:SDR family oxidoreductase [Neisseria sp. Ec49-e6-T10]|uniref:SDR family oxidoreductase n=1 Tax=Neisseria sp. Ec49-e6-T10 TaxID=3140744 RepID=UPI003EBB18C8